ncbi:G-protein coupled receptor GRL101-like [Ptychodera flava]|uniref:G-protein coupled receptor GRL101-like n=1 Tax=Ptychodera flava TaxID=63121 RepID=UPI00396A2BC1
MFQAESSELFVPLIGLAELYTDAYKYCCMVRKRQEVQVCSPPADAFSSCEDLMANQVLRWSIWMLGIAAFFGNLFVIVWRIKEKDLGKVHTSLIWNLAVADFMMGIYMLIIASVDMNYRGVYVTYDASWRSSSLCSFAGFLASLSILYLTMYLAIRRTTLATGAQLQQKARETAAIAKRMTLIVLTDFFCWVPIAVMGMLAMTDTVTVPGSVYAWTAVFILPINSAINPFLYTISVIKMKRKPQQSAVNTNLDLSYATKYQMRVYIL